MKFQFFLRGFSSLKNLDKVCKHLDNNKLSEAVCTTSILGDVVEEVDRNNVIAVIDYPYGNSSCFARKADVDYCIEMGIKNIEMPINSDLIIESNLSDITDEFNELYELCSKKKCVLKPLIDYRLLMRTSDKDEDFISNTILFLKKEIAIDSVTINSGQLSDYFSENLDMCRNLKSNGISPTTFWELHNKNHIHIMREHVYRLRFSNSQSLRLL